MKRLLATLVALAAIWPAAAIANVFNWQGTCSFGCTGVAHGVLTLASGDPFNFDQAEFVSWQYSSSSGTYSMDASPPGLYAKGYPVGSNSVFFLESDELGPQITGSYLFQFAAFAFSPSYPWQQLVGRYGDICLNTDCSLNTYDVRDGGDGFFFTTSVPEPSTWLSLVIGISTLLCFGMLRPARLA